ncbi:hypothetical protein MRB53_005194 [Persea americana]|uniref:Uncharacterized protein n=1 Tax=Persea americana TaxID=3435 RepID=A0ACC2MDI3_PERAE|nr:hypothetical protein MRB53_005194 [Persea americana]
MGYIGISSSSSNDRFLLLLVTSTLLLFSCLPSATCSVTYDRKAIVINGQRRILISGSIHYPRSTPEMWPDLIQKAKEGGLDVIQTYVFWDGHEPSPGKYYFEGRYDLVKFIKLVKQAGLYVNLRIGPYICAEWNLGGFPVWLKYIPGISFRTDNEPFKRYMAGFTKKIVEMMKAESLFEPQGGPIIMSQIENEYGPVEWEIGAIGKVYTRWAASMAVNLNTGVPWIMCKQDEVPDPIINTCNGFYCDWFKPNKDYKPIMWTELWTGWFTAFGGPVPYRPVEDVAYAVVKFIQKGGSFINYYMYHGGTNFGRTAGGPFIATSYDYDAPLDEYGLKREPKWGHLRDLHRAIKMCEPALVSNDPTVTKIGDSQEAHVFKFESGACSAFLENKDETNFVKVTFQGMQYELPPWSISILPDCVNVVYNTGRVGTQTSMMTMLSASNNEFSWASYNEDTASYNEESMTIEGLSEQISITKDSTDYLRYTTDVTIGQNEGFLKNGEYPVLTVNSAGHALQVFVNGQLSGTAYGSVNDPRLTFSGKVKLWAGNNKISLLSSAVGLPNVGTHFETWNYGVLGPVTLNGLNEGKRDLSLQKWSYKVGVIGEALQLHSPTGSSSVEWGSSTSKIQPFTWYKTTFNAPGGNDPLALDMNTMGKGQIWINGQSIGRYWPAYKANGKCSACHYTGWYDEKKCGFNCGEASQRWYHIPRSWLNPTGNLLVVFEEWGGDPTGITLVRRTIGSACAYINEWHPTVKNWKIENWGKAEKWQSPTVELSCRDGQKISSIRFASFGTPEGACGSYRQGSCHAQKSYDPFQKSCVGQQSCKVIVTAEAFGGDPCPNVEKNLAVEAICQ